MYIRKGRNIYPSRPSRLIVKAIPSLPTRNQYGTTVMQQMTYIDEANLYRCIFQSRKAEAGKQKDSTYLVWTPKGAEMIYKMIKAKLE